MPRTRDYFEDYNDARRLGLRRYRQDTALGRQPSPPVLDELVSRENILAEVPVGTMEIPLYQVVGTRTAGRTSAFSSDFMPLLKESTEFAYKWADLRKAQAEEGIRDPIKAYEYMHQFYVQEGNKRVSVSKYIGLSSITADITRVIPRRTDDKKNQIYYEFMDFFKVCPIYEIDFSETGRFHKLAAALGQNPNLETPWSQDLVQSLKAALAIFWKLFQNKGGDKLGITCGDAFLIYLTFYPLETLETDSEEVINDRLSKLWNEFLTDTDEGGITLIETPQDIKDRGHLLDFLREPVYSLDHPLKAAFLYDRDPSVSDWIYEHELGRNHLDDYFGGLVKTSRFDNCADDAAIGKAVDQAVAAGNDIIFTTSPVMMEETLRCAIHYPDVKFLNCSVNLSHNAVRTYYVKMYEAKFILGAVAASLAEDHKIGYLANYPIYGTIANINAFAIGAAMIDPKVKIYLEWSRIKDHDWRDGFAKEGLRIISGPDMIRPNQPGREYGVYYLKGDGTFQSIGVPVWNWGRYYELIVRTVLEGTWQAREVARNDNSLNYWWGMSSGVIDVFFSDTLTYYTYQLVEMLVRGILSDQLDPFEGERNSQKQQIQGRRAPRLSNEEIITMNWLNDNIIGHIPTFEELDEEGRSTVSVSGVSSVR